MRNSAVTLYPLSCRSRHIPWPRLHLFSLLLLGLCLLTMAMPAAAQNGEKRDSVGRDAVDAVSQPLNDLNIVSRDIPPVLVLATKAPYDLTDVTGCDAIHQRLDTLDEVLGPDADAEQRGDGLANSALKLGGKVLGGFIPFRGLVRQISGASSREKAMDAAIYAGIARRSFLKGYAKGLQCPTREEAAIANAEDVLGMSGRK